jgi:hypothetical protein
MQQGSQSKKIAAYPHRQSEKLGQDASRPELITKVCNMGLRLRSHESGGDALPVSDYSKPLRSARDVCLPPSDFVGPALQSGFH